MPLRALEVGELRVALHVLRFPEGAPGSAGTRGACPAAASRRTPPAGCGGTAPAWRRARAAGLPGRRTRRPGTGRTGRWRWAGRSCARGSARPWREAVRAVHDAAQVTARVAVGCLQVSRTGTCQSVPTWHGHSGRRRARRLQIEHMMPPVASRGVREIVRGRPSQRLRLSIRRPREEIAKCCYGRRACVACRSVAVVVSQLVTANRSVRRRRAPLGRQTRSRRARMTRVARADQCLRGRRGSTIAEGPGSWWAYIMRRPWRPRASPGRRPRGMLPAGARARSLLAPAFALAVIAVFPSQLMGMRSCPRHRRESRRRRRGCRSARRLVPPRPPSAARASVTSFTSGPAGRRMIGHTGDSPGSWWAYVRRATGSWRMRPAKTRGSRRIRQTGPVFWFVRDNRE